MKRKMHDCFISNGCIKLGPGNSVDLAKIVLKFCAFLFFENNAVQSTILFLFLIVDKILQTISVVKKSAAAAMQKIWLSLMATSDKCQ